VKPSILITDGRLIASYLGTLATIGLLTSPPLANIAEALMVGIVLLDTELRRSLLATWRYPVVKALALFFCILLIGAVYSDASAKEIRHGLTGWLHRMLLLPFALAIFVRVEDKMRFVRTYAGANVLFAAISVVLWLTGSLPFGGEEPGVILRNHSTQGMGFAVSALLAAWLAFDTETKRLRFFWAAACAFLILNIAFVTTGRSGYVVLLVSACVFVAFGVFRSDGKVPARLRLGAVIALALIGILLVAAPSSQERLKKAVDEVQGSQQATEYTSMGIRMVFWRNTVELIGQRPWLGHGTASFATVYKEKVVGQTGFRAIETQDPHNQFMKIIAENGILGLAAFFAVIVAALMTPATSPWRMLATAVLLSWSATSLFNAHFSTFSEGHFIFLWLGIMLAGVDWKSMRSRGAG
jgi:O-antigen ligase